MDFLDNIEKVVGSSKEIYEGQHLLRKEGYTHSKYGFEVEDELSEAGEQEEIKEEDNEDDE